MLNYYRQYIADYDFWSLQHIKSKKRFKTIIAVMYGKKKDHGGIKRKYLALMKAEEEKEKLILEAINRVCPQLKGMIRYLGMN